MPTPNPWRPQVHYNSLFVEGQEPPLPPRGKLLGSERLWVVLHGRGSGLRQIPVE